MTQKCERAGISVSKAVGSGLCSLSSNSTSKLDVLWHNRDSFSMNSTEIGIFKEAYKVSL